MAVPEALSRAVRSPAHERCQYCLMHESLQGAAFHLEHVIPQSKGGESVLETLALARPGCNLRKAYRTRRLIRRQLSRCPCFIQSCNTGRNTSDSKVMKWKERLPLAAQRWQCSISITSAVSGFAKLKRPSGCILQLGEEILPSNP